MMNLIFVLLACLVSNSLFGDIHTWTDPKTQRDYVLLNGFPTWQDMEHQCRAQGLAVFDWEHLTSEEQKALLSSGFLEHLTWKTHAKGTKQENNLAMVWMGSRVMVEVSAGSDFASSVLLVDKTRKGTLNLAMEYQGGLRPEINGMCMSIEVYWYQCSVGYRCTFGTGPNEVLSSYIFSDYGASENEAMQYILKTTSKPKWSVSSGKCLLRTESAICNRVIP